MKRLIPLLLVSCGSTARADVVIDAAMLPPPLPTTWTVRDVDCSPPCKVPFPGRGVNDLARGISVHCTIDGACVPHLFAEVRNGMVLTFHEAGRTTTVIMPPPF